MNMLSIDRGKLTRALFLIFSTILVSFVLYIFYTTDLRQRRVKRIGAILVKVQRKTDRSDQPLLD